MDPKNILGRPGILLDQRVVIICECHVDPQGRDIANVIGVPSPQHMMIRREDR